MKATLQEQLLDAMKISVDRNGYGDYELFFESPRTAESVMLWRSPSKEQLKSRMAVIASYICDVVESK